jgi:hypothetical protein
VNPWKPAKWDYPDAAAIQALAQGNATEGQQKRALRFIVEGLCATYDMSYRPDSQRDTDFAEGKRHVGNQIVKLTKVNLNAMKLAKEKKK